MWAVQKKNLTFAQIGDTPNVQYAGFVAALSFCDYIISQSIYTKPPMSYVNINTVPLRYEEV